jgi:PhoPQ-activated pathogenicity-related protein
MLKHQSRACAPSGLRPVWRLACLPLAVLLACSAADTARRGLAETALDRYVAKPDPAFAWKKVSEVREEGAVSCAIDMISQQWLTPDEVNRLDWRHWVNIIKPDSLAHSTALLFITGGSNRPGPPPKPSRELVDIAKATGCVVVELRMVPNQPLVFDRDGRERKEDDLIAYTWDKFLRTGDERWPARLPMTKAAVRAMDTTTAFLASEEGGRANVDAFVVAGASKRGWTAWTTAAVDRRVVAICPMVIDVLNIEASILHHYRAYGFYAPAVADYSSNQIMDWIGTPESKALYAIEDPFSYRDRLSLPKLLINACGDQYFLPDSSRLYFEQLPGPKYLRYIPNTDHSLKNSDAIETLKAWQHAIATKTRLPELTWQRASNGSLTVRSSIRPRSVRLWQATNPAARDFRLESLGPAWTSTAVSESGGEYSAAVPKPEQGWTAFLLEFAFDIGARFPLKLTTEVTVTPNTLPFTPPTPPQPKGFLSRGTELKGNRDLHRAP